MNKKKVIIIGAVLFISIASITIIIIQKNTHLTSNELIDNKVVGEIVVNEIKFTDIKFKYQDGISTLTAKMKNETSEMKTFNIKIILLDENNKEVKNMLQLVEDLKAEEERVFSSGFMGNYENVKTAKFEIVGD